MNIQALEMIDMFDKHLATFLVEGKRKDIQLDWVKVEACAEYLPVTYTRAFIDYQTAYWEGHNSSFIDVSIVLYDNNKPVGIWPLSLMNISEQVQVGSLGGILLPPIFDQKLPDKSVSRLTLSCQKFLRELCLLFRLKGWESTESHPQQSWLSNWHLNAMKNGAIIKVRHDLFVDLFLDIPLIKQRFRESYKALINSSKKYFDVDVFSNLSENLLRGDDLKSSKIWNEFRALHLTEAGRVTRTEKSWNLQYQAILSGDAFLVRSTDKNGRLVGGGLFNISKNEGYYSVGAYDRSLFDKPIGHAIQFQAIEEMKKLGINFYHIGEIFYAGECLARSEKQSSITHFKSGFATHVFPRYIIKQTI